jgi:hypothetical protein
VDTPFLGSASELTPQRLRGKAYRRVWRDVYVASAADLDLRLRAEAAVVAVPDAVVSRSTAGVLQRLPVRDDGLVHLSRSAKAAQTVRDGVVVHRCPVEADETVVVAGLRLSDPARTFVDLAATSSFEELVALGDAVVRRQGRAAVEAAVARRRRRRGLVLARAVLPLLDPGAASPPESRMRVRLHAAGFTALRHGVVVSDGSGGWVAEPDLADDVARVAVRYEGAVHFDGGVERWRHDLQRDELTRLAGWQVVVATALDDRRPHLPLQKVTGAYRRAAQLHGAHVLPPLLAA